METRAPFAVIGGFVLAAIVAIFGFVYWLNKREDLGHAQAITCSSRVQFPVFWSGLPFFSTEFVLAK